MAEVERDTAIRFEQAESLVNHVDVLARRGQAELEGQLKQLTDTMEVQLLEHLSDEFKGTSLAVAELGVQLERRVRDFGELTKFVLENIKVADQLHDDLKEKVLHAAQQVTSLEEWGNDITTNLNEIDARVDNLEQWCEELAASL